MDDVRDIFSAHKVSVPSAPEGEFENIVSQVKFSDARTMMWRSLAASVVLLGFLGLLVQQVYVSPKERTLAYTMLLESQALSLDDAQELADR